MDLEKAKKQAALAACEELPLEGVLGLGTGSTSRYFLEEIGRLVQHGRNYRGVPTSVASRILAEKLGIPLLPEDGPWEITMTIDGADEVDPSLHLIKGGGGAHTREKIVHTSSRKSLIVVDETKLSNKLGEKRAVPVEVLAFGHRETARCLARFGKLTLREQAGKPWVTDSGNLLYDVHTGPICDAEGLDRSLREFPGVVETGLFLYSIDALFIAGEHGVRRVTPAKAREPYRA